MAGGGRRERTIHQLCRGIMSDRRVFPTTCAVPAVPHSKGTQICLFVGFVLIDVDMKKNYLK